VAVPQTVICRCSSSRSGSPSSRSSLIGFSIGATREMLQWTDATPSPHLNDRDARLRRAAAPRPQVTLPQAEVI
jgi:hypothetical protein